MTRLFGDLSPEEVLALAIHVERANTRRFLAFADVFRGYDDAVADRFAALAEEETRHERLLTSRFQDVFGDDVPVLDEVSVEGVVESVDLDAAEHLVFDSLTEERVYELALEAERGAADFYRRALAATRDARLEHLYRELLAEEESHAAWLLDRMAHPGRPAASTANREGPRGEAP